MRIARANEQWVMHGPGDAHVLDGRGGGSGRDFMRAHWRDVFSILGATSLGTGTPDLDIATARFASRNLAVLADNVMRDTIRGARIVVGVSGPDDGEVAWWANHADNMIRVVDSLPGVWHHIKEGGRVSFWTTSEAARLRLEEFVSDTLGGLSVSFVSVPGRR